MGLPKGAIKWAIGVGVALLVIVSAGGLWWWLSLPTSVETAAPSVRTYFPKPSFLGGPEVTVTDTSGQQHEEDVPSDVGEVDQTITVEDDTSQGTRRLFVEKRRTWFPELRGRPTTRIRGFSDSDTQGVTATIQTPPLVGWDWSAILGGGSYVIPEGPSVAIGYLPLRLWAFRVGPFLHVRDEPKLHASVAVEVRERLHLVGGVPTSALLDGTISEASVGLSYRF